MVVSLPSVLLKRIVRLWAWGAASRAPQGAPHGLGSGVVGADRVVSGALVSQSLIHNVTSVHQSARHVQYTAVTCTADI